MLWGMRKLRLLTAVTATAAVAGTLLVLPASAIPGLPANIPLALPEELCQILSTNPERLFLVSPPAWMSPVGSIQVAKLLPGIKYVPMDNLLQSSRRPKARRGLTDTWQKMRLRLRPAVCMLVLTTTRDPLETHVHRPNTMPRNIIR